MKSLTRTALAFHGAPVVLLALFGCSRSQNHQRQVCSHCGLERVVDERRVGMVTYQRTEHFQTNAVSHALQVPACRHEWMLLRLGRSCGPFLASRLEHADGGVPYWMSVHLLLRDDRFASDLLGMQEPSAVWGALLNALHGNSELGKSLERWWWDADRPSFAVWWAEHGNAVGSTGGPPP